ncbi:hypothetical protein DPQ25_12705 [Hydrogeniiclostridium mannosilyticum]|uniref:Uncharacterized protein n=1 Tax=Hydrogeniiclostridium mannosilyticum TaxID=2764322 RepID=A0A328UA56_9FIRM|nr:hypothetical protein [Hydrogeniiclostridium mannosilyticum]RAQ22490.1 hypothetical protein DPQ25_12705 [Hydrogeniiclostridium mannosilyticum]
MAMPMNVSFDSSLWREPKGKAGRPQWVYWAFRCDGCLYTIPALYHFEQGLVFDVLQPLSERELNLFYQKYQRYDGEGDPLLSALEHQIEQESPVRRLSLQNICVDGLVCTDFSSSASARTPWNQEALAEWREAYADCLQQQFFACQRFCLPYKHRSTQENIGSLALTVREREVFYPLSASFSLEAGLRQKKLIKWQYPFTGEELTFTFQHPVQEEAMLNHAPLYIASAVYTCTPAPPQKIRLAFDSSFQEEGCMEAGSIGMIGGCNGPTAIFCADSLSEKPDGQLVYAKPSRRRNESPRFQLTGVFVQARGNQTFRLGDHISSSAR